MSAFNRSGFKGPAAVNIEDLLQQLKELCPDGLSASIQVPSSRAQYQAMLRQDALRAAGELSQERMQHKKDRVQQLEEQGKLNPEWTFDNLSVHAGNDLALKTAKQFCLCNFARCEPQLLLITGPENSGKTALGQAMAHMLLQRQNLQSVLMVPYADIHEAGTRSVISMQDVQKIQEKEEQFERYCSADILIVDDVCPDLSALYPTDQKILADLLRKRHDRHLSMVLLTPVLPENLHTCTGNYCYESMKMYAVTVQALKLS